MDSKVKVLRQTRSFVKRANFKLKVIIILIVINSLLSVTTLFLMR